MSYLPDLPTPSRAERDLAHRALMKAFDPVRAHCAWVEAPFGRVFLARTERGLCRVSFRKREDRLLSELESRALLPEMAPSRLDRERRELEQYFRGRRRGFDLAIDLRWGTEFQKDVLRAASEIPFGSLLSYSELAKRIHRPKAQRAVGSALGKNPIAIVIPCHRVVASGGKLGGYTGGLDIKRTLMGIEGIQWESVS